jgi:Co/Zn/Cd efflux system component
VYTAALAAVDFLTTVGLSKRCVFSIGLQAYLRSGGKQQRVALFLCANTLYMAVEFIVGYRNNSIGMLSDAIHMLFDNASILVRA